MNSTRSRRWSRLDNAAKIFPSNSTPSDSKVFRFACELAEPVDPAALQAALRVPLQQVAVHQRTQELQRPGAVGQRVGSGPGPWG